MYTRRCPHPYVIAACCLIASVCSAQGPETEAVVHVPMRALTRGGAHWYGYYDKLQFGPGDREILGMAVGFQGRTPAPEDTIELGVIDTVNGDAWTTIGSSRAWNWQQGCMLQWIPGEGRRVIYNDRRESGFVSVIHDLDSGEERVLPYPIYCLSPDGVTAVTIDFERLARTRPGYGYAGGPESLPEDIHPADNGVFSLNLQTGERTLLYSLADIAQVNHRPDMDGGHHWFNHLLFNQDGTRFIFLHRWRSTPSLSGTWSTRMFTSDAAGGNLHSVADDGVVSHFIWKNPAQILAWSREPDTGIRFHLYDDQTSTRAVIGGDVLTRDGHCTYHPGGEWILTDTYPDKDRMQTLMLYRPRDGKLVELGRFYLPRVPAAEFRCDLHPRWSRDGRFVCIDSMHSGTRQMYLLDVSEIVATAE